MKELHVKAKQDKITLTGSRALVSDSSGNVAVSAVTSTELGYLDGVTSAVQTQLNNKAAASDLTNHISSFNTHNSDTTKHITSAERTTWNGKQDAISGAANSVMITDANGKPTVSSVITVAELNKLNGLTPTTTELNYLDGATSNIQNQIDNIKLGVAVPDYSKGTTLTADTEFTTTSNGVLYYKYNCSYAAGPYYMYLWIGTVRFIITANDGSYDSGMYPVKANTVVKYEFSEATQNSGEVKFFPYG